MGLQWGVYVVAVCVCVTSFDLLSARLLPGTTLMKKNSPTKLFRERSRSRSRSRSRKGRGCICEGRADMLHPTL